MLSCVESGDSTDNKTQMFAVFVGAHSKELV